MGGTFIKCIKSGKVWSTVNSKRLTVSYFLKRFMATPMRTENLFGLKYHSQSGMQELISTIKIALAEGGC